MYKNSQSLVDFLVEIMPGVIDLNKSTSNYIDSRAARSLFKIWYNDKNKISNNIYQRPPTVSRFEIDLIKNSGLAREVGDKIEITKKGEDVIKTMILGDDSSIFEKDEKIDYKKALLAVNQVRSKTAKSISKKASDQWWFRFLKKGTID